MNIQKGLIFYLTIFFILSLIFFPEGKVSDFVNSTFGYFWRETYFNFKDWNLIFLCVVIAFIIKMLMGQRNRNKS